MFIRKITLLFLVAGFAGSAWGQRVLTDSSRIAKKTKSLLDRKAEIDTLLGRGKLSNNYVTPSNFSKIIQTKFRTFSGLGIKSGKALGSSASVDSKSITANVSFKPFVNQEIYLSPTITGSSNNGFVNVFTGDKYSRTITGGFNLAFPILINHSLGFSRYDRLLMHNSIKVLRYKYLHPNSKLAEKSYQDILNELLTIYHNSGNFISSYYRSNFDTIQIKNPQVIDDLEKYQKDVDLLINAKIISADFTKLDISSQIRICTRQMKTIVNSTSLADYLDQADAVQQKASFGIQVLHWLAGNLKYNQGNYNIADSTTKKLVSDARDQYLSASFSYNEITIFENGIRVYLSPTINYSNAHAYVTANQLHAQIFTPSKIGGTTVQQVSKDITYYAKVPPRLQTYYFEMPVAVFSPKAGLGGEFVVKWGKNDVNDDNFGFKLGALVPVGETDKNQLIIEPIFQLQKLNEGTSNFWSNNVVFGINASITIPKSFFQ